MGWFDSLVKVAPLVTAGVNAYNAYSAGNRAEKATNASNALSQEQLQMAKEAQQRYYDIYGNIEENLGKYYEHLTPSKAEQLGLSRYDTMFKNAHNNYIKSMAQRGLLGSGIDAEGEMRMNMQAAQDRTNIVNQADTQSRHEQLGFLGVGLGQSNIAAQNVSNSYRSATGALNNQANIASQEAGMAANAAGNLLGSAAYNLGRHPNYYKNLFGDE